MDYPIMKIALEHLNFTYELIGTKLHGYNNKLSGKWNGLVDELESGRCAVGGKK